MSKEISKYQNLDQIGGQFMNARNKLKETESEISQILEKKLKPEKDNLEDAIKKYNEKAKKVLESKDLKNLQDKHKKHSNDAKNNLIKAQNEFVKITNEIKDKDWPKEKKDKKIKELYDYILDKLYSKDDIENFKKLMTSIVIMESPDNN